MANSALFKKYETLLHSLHTIISVSEKRILDDTPDTLFIQHPNFFIKSYLINICTYLEAFLQELAYDHIQFIQEKIKNASIPKNVILWIVQKDVKNNEWDYNDFVLELTKKDISDHLSGNPYKTIKLFQYIGINLSTEEDFASNKDFVSSIITKRNNIIHHNDDAMDVSFSDLIIYIASVLQYMNAIDCAVTTQGRR